MSVLACTWLGRRDFQSVWDLQEEIRSMVLAGDANAERVLFVEHEPVITLGRSAKAEHLLWAEDERRTRGVAMVACNRGGDVTYHGPGQLVIYPIVRLTRGVLAHVRSIGEAISAELTALGVPAHWRRQPLGVWVGDKKVAACGVHVRRDVAVHGYALNVRDEVLDGFSAIVPCGLRGVEVTTLERLLPRQTLELTFLARRLAERLCETWKRSCNYACDLA